MESVAGGLVMADSRQQASFDQFINRYEKLKQLYFSRNSDLKYEDGQIVPSAFLNKSQIVEIFQKQMKVQLPTGPNDKVIRFLDGTEHKY
jgi:hypothetical protein